MIVFFFLALLRSVISSSILAHTSKTAGFMVNVIRLSLFSKYDITNLLVDVYGVATQSLPNFSTDSIKALKLEFLKRPAYAIFKVSFA